MNSNYSMLTDLLREHNTQWQQLLEPILVELGVTFVDRIILDKLSINSGVSKNDLAKSLGTMHQNLTRSISRLEQQGLVKISKNPLQDKRQIYLVITPEGEKINGEINSKINAIWGKIFLDTPLSEVEKLTMMLSNINQRLIAINQ